MLLSDFDPDRKAVINPEDVLDPMPGFPEICIGIFSKAIVDELVNTYHAVPMFQSNFCTGPVPVYRVAAYGQEAALFLPHVGAPSAVSFMEELIPRGGKYFVFSGCAGVLRHDIADGHLILPTAALRDEGTSYHYLPPSDEVVLDPDCVSACRSALEALGLSYVEGKTWTTDAFYRETKSKVEQRKAQGCVSVEMECASLAAVARFRGVDFAQFFYAADSLGGPEWDQRSLGRWAQRDPEQDASVSEKCLAAAIETGRRMQRMRN